MSASGTFDTLQTNHATAKAVFTEQTYGDLQIKAEIGEEFCTQENIKKDETTVVKLEDQHDVVSQVLQIGIDGDLY